MPCKNPFPKIEKCPVSQAGNKAYALPKYVLQPRLHLTICNFLKPHQASSGQSKQINEKAPKFSAFIFIYSYDYIQMFVVFFLSCTLFCIILHKKGVPLGYN